MFRGLSKMEEDPMIPQRMRDTIRTQICTAEAAAINDCGKEMVTLFFFCLNSSTGCPNKF